MTDQLSRRELLRAAGIVSATAMLRQEVLPPALAAAATLTSSEYATIEAIVARIIPSEGKGPGAKEAQAARYIDRALSGALESARSTYGVGLAAVNVYSRATRGAPFAELSAADQDAILTDMQENRATGFNPDSASFFNLLRAHTIQGTFADPFYGGNANFAGWDLVGYPGVRMAVPADLQRIDAPLTPNHRSVYDFGMFSKGEM